MQRVTDTDSLWTIPLAPLFPICPIYAQHSLRHAATTCDNKVVRFVNSALVKKAVNHLTLKTNLN